MAGVTASLKISLDAVLTGTAGITTPSAGVSVKDEIDFAAGSANVYQADLMFADTRALGPSASENLDLSGVLTSPLGAVIAAAEVVGIYLKCLTGAIVVGAAASNGFFGPLNSTGTLTLSAGEFTMLSSQNGWTVTAATGDLLKVAATPSSTYKIVIIARSVAR